VSGITGRVLIGGGASNFVDGGSIRGGIKTTEIFSTQGNEHRASGPGGIKITGTSGGKESSGPFTQKGMDRSSKFRGGEFEEHPGGRRR